MDTLKIILKKLFKWFEGPFECYPGMVCNWNNTKLTEEDLKRLMKAIDGDNIK